MPEPPNSEYSGPLKVTEIHVPDKLAITATSIARIGNCGKFKRL